MDNANKTKGRTRPVASVSLDLDNQWSYMKTHGDAGWESFPSYLDVLLPYTCDVLADHGLSITFFVVGQDAVLEKNREALALIPGAGHTVGNHSFNHEPWFHLYDRSQVIDEIARTEGAIESSMGIRPTVFRGPGFSFCPMLLEVLAERGYVLDASTLPTFIGPLARMYYFWTSKFTKEEREQRKALFGTLAEGFRPVRPYAWRVSTGTELLEIPVTTIPVVRTPFHLSYLLYLSRFSMKLMKAYLGTAITLCRLTGTEPSFLLHPLDLLGGDQVPELRFFPGMDLDAARKREVFDYVIGRLAKHFELVDMYEHAELIAAGSLKQHTVPAAEGA